MCKREPGKTVTRRLADIQNILGSYIKKISEQTKHTLPYQLANMELKPVLHHNGCLNFEASSMLHNIIAKIKGQFVHKILLLLCVFTLYSMKLFHLSGNVVTLGFVLAEIIFLFLASWVFYYNVKMVQSIILTIANQVSITDDKIAITPFTYNLPFSNKTHPDRLEFKINELKIRKTDNPSMFTKALGNRMFLLKDKEKEAYIVSDYFDPALKVKLMDILVQVTPPELLLPGRLRHY